MSKPAPSQGDDLVTAAQAAVILRESIPTVNRRALRGELVAAVEVPGRGGRKVTARLFRRADVEALAEKLRERAS